MGGYTLSVGPARPDLRNLAPSVRGVRVRSPNFTLRNRWLALVRARGVRGVLLHFTCLSAARLARLRVAPVGSLALAGIIALLHELTVCCVGGVEQVATLSSLPHSRLTMESCSQAPSLHVPDPPPGDASLAIRRTRLAVMWITDDEVGTRPRPAAACPGSVPRERTTARIAFASRPAPRRSQRGSTAIARGTQT